MRRRRRFADVPRRRLNAYPVSGWLPDNVSVLQPLSTVKSRMSCLWACLGMSAAPWAAFPTRHHLRVQPTDDT
jgi:hypothetical protein